MGVWRGFPSEGDYSVIYGWQDDDKQTGANLKKYMVYSGTVGEYSGVTDKNGVYVFEGDIMAFDADGEHHVGVVRFVDGNMYVVCKTVASYLNVAIKIYGAQVIGDVYDNPELLWEVNNE